jgi:hypothetical protein
VWCHQSMIRSRAIGVSGGLAAGLGQLIGGNHYYRNGPSGALHLLWVGLDVGVTCVHDKIAARLESRGGDQGRRGGRRGVTSRQQGEEGTARDCRTETHGTLGTTLARRLADGPLHSPLDCAGSPGFAP